MIRQDFDHVSHLQYIIRNQQREIDSYKSGEAITKLRKSFMQIINEQRRTINKLTLENLKLGRSMSIMRKNWEEVCDDVSKEADKKVEIAEKKVKKLEDELVKRDTLILKLREQLSSLGDSYSESLTKIEDLEGKNQKLTAQLNKDFETSSIPSSKQGAERKRIPNQREKTERKPGAQEGHEAHLRKKQVPTRVVKLPAPDFVLKNPDRYSVTKNVIKKQVVSLKVFIDVTEYEAVIYRDKVTGSRIHAKFPDNCINDVNYDGSVKAYLYQLCNSCNTSIDSARRFLCEVTGGKLNVSKGMVSKLVKEFSEKSKDEQDKITELLMKSPVMNADFTNANVNGKAAQVLILASPLSDACQYIFKEHKGHEGIKETPLEHYWGTVVHDHDTTFYSYGTKHQECQQHNLRYLLGCIQNEPNLTWAVKMRDVLRDAIHYKNSLGEYEEPDTDKIDEIVKRYDEALEIAAKEYEENPPNAYYREGYNLQNRLRKYKESELSFLYDKKIPSNNSLCERHARVFKRKQAEATVFRSKESLACLLEGMSVVDYFKTRSEDMYAKMMEVFNRVDTESLVKMKAHQFKPIA